MKQNNKTTNTKATNLTDPLQCGFNASKAPLLVPAISLWVGTSPLIRDLGFDLVPASNILLLAITMLLAQLPGPRRILWRLLVPFIIGLLLAPEPAFPVTQLPAGPVLLEATVVGVPHRILEKIRSRTQPQQTILKVGHLKGKQGPISGAMLISIPGQVFVGRGDTIQVLLAAGQSTFRKIVHETHWKIIERGKLLSQFDRLRLVAIDSLMSIGARWGCALLLGERRLLEPETQWMMKRTGLGHFLAVSGLHVGICLGFFLALSRRCLPPWSQLVRCFGAMFLLCQALLSGADPPAIRAAITGGLFAIGLVAGRNASSVQSLAFAVLIWCAMGQGPPDGSATISLLAVGGIYLTNGFQNTNFQKTTETSIRPALGAFFGAHVGLVWWTPEMCPLSPLWTLLLLPIVAFTIFLSCLTLFLYRFNIEHLAEQPWALISTVLEKTLIFADRFPGSPWIVPAIGIPAISLAMITLLWINAGKPRLALASFIMMFLAMAIQSWLPIPPTIELLPTGRGQSLLAQADGTALLFDAGSSDRLDGGASLIRKSLWKIGKSKLDWMIISHAHLDHYSAVPELIETNSIGGIIVDQRFHEDPAGASLLQIARRHQVAIQIVQEGDYLTIGSWSLRIISAADPTGPAPRLSINNQSLVIELRGPAGSALIPGDAESPRLAASRSSGPIDIVLLPHHGAAMNGLENWLSLLSPRKTYVARPTPLPAATIKKLQIAGIQAVQGSRPVTEHTRSDSPRIPPLSLITSSPALPLRRLEGWRRWWIRPHNNSRPCTGLVRPTDIST